MSHIVQNPVRAALLNARLAAASPFERWCYMQRVQHLPAAPANVAAFVRDQAARPIEEIWEAVEEISQSHLANGLADPTAGGPVADVMNELSKLDAPKSWPKEMKARFSTLPYDIQVYLAAREKERDTAVRRAQNSAADAQQKLTSLQKIVTGKADNSVTTEIKTNTDAA